MDIRECIPETQHRKPGQQTPREIPIIGHRVVQLGAIYFNRRIDDIGARWVRIECDMPVQIRVNNILVCDGMLQVSASGAPERLFFPDTTVFPTFRQSPLAFEYAGEVNSIDLTLVDSTAVDVDLRALVHVYWSSDSAVRVVPGRPHHYVYEKTKLSGWDPVARWAITDLCLNSFLAPAAADAHFPVEIEVTGMGVENPIAFAGFDVTRQSIIWRDSSDLNTIREFCRVCHNVGGAATNQSFHHEFGVPVRIPYIAMSQAVAGAPLLPALQMELRHNGGGPFPEDLIVYFNYRVV